MHTGWLQDGGHWYFMRGNGAMATGWRDMDGSWYFFNQDGQMVTGWQSIDGIWYYFDGNGHMATGITDVGGVKYYLDDQGRMAANTEVTVDGVNYTADGSGALSLVEQPPAEGGEASNESPDGQSSPDAGQSGTNDAPVITGVSGGPGV